MAPRRLRRRIKNALLASEPIYRVYLRAKFGSSSVTRLPEWPTPSGALKTTAEWQHVLALGREHHLPLHRGPEKNWDHLAAVFTILESVPPPARILDAGAEFYSNVLPALFLAGYRELYGLNLAFTDFARHGPIRYEPGDITATRFPDCFFDAVTCLSVIEHGVPLAAYFREMHRILRPGGLLITSTDYFPTPIDTAGKSAHGAPVRVFTRPEIEACLDLALLSGFELTSPIDLDCTERPIHWREVDLRYTFLLFTLRKRHTGATGPTRCEDALRDARHLLPQHTSPGCFAARHRSRHSPLRCPQPLFTVTYRPRLVSACHPSPLWLGAHRQRNMGALRSLALAGSLHFSCDTVLIPQLHRGTRVQPHVFSLQQ